MKKLLALLCAVAYLLLLTACGKQDAPQPTEKPVVVTEAPTATPTAEPVVVTEAPTTEPTEAPAAEATEAVEKKVSSIKVKETPAKTSYFTNEEFTAEGGTIVVTYDDGTTQELAMTDPALDLTAPSTSRSGSKTVTIKYGGKKTTFKVKVSVKGMTVTFQLGGDAGVIEQNVTKGYTALEETAPAREGYTFENWYADEACTVLFDFDTIIEADTTVYAKWLDNSAVYHKVNFDMNYYGCSTSGYPQVVKSGEAAVVPAITPERIDYTFNGWFLDPQGGTAFDAAAAITADTTVYASWTKAKTGVTVYTFEAEDIDLSQKAGPGYSGENAGIGMIVTNKETQASGDKFVAYQCKYGNSLEFNIASDADTAEVVLYVRVAAEFSSMVLTPDTYEISVNGVPVKYGQLDLQLSDSSQQGTFADYNLGKITLTKGANLIQFKTINNDALGGTLTATAPIIDCIKLETSDVVIWDGVYGLPMDNY